MAKYKVNCSSLNIRNGPSTSNAIVGSYKKNDDVSVYDQKKMGPVTWGRVDKSKQKWVSMTYLKAVSSGSKTSKDTTSKKKDVGTAKENSDKVQDDTIYGNKDINYANLYRKYLRAFGCPPRFTSEVDPRYSGISGVNVGRAVAETWFSNPSVLSLCPGTVDYLPGFGFKNKKKNELFNKLKSSMSGDVKSNAVSDQKMDINGPLYAFKSAYTDYINVVNLLARTAADLMGIGNVNNLLAGNSIALNKFDYGYYTTKESSKKAGNIFQETARSFNSAVSDSSYIHFFVNYTNGVTGNDSFQTQAGASWLEEQIGDGESSGLSTTARNMQFLFGSTLSGQAAKDVNQVIQKATEYSDFLGGMTTIAKNYLKGGRLVFPKMITGMSYEKSIQCELTFTSIYGDKRSIFKYVTLPALHLLALATPKQLSSNMYTYPFLVRAYQKGNINTDLAFISNLELIRGGSDNTSWTVDGLATEITARFTITPLYSNMMVTSSRNPFLFMQNSSLLEYLGTMCGLDLKMNNITVKVKVAKSVLGNLVHDTPTVMARAISDSALVNGIRNFAQIVN